MFFHISWKKFWQKAFVVFMMKLNSLTDIVLRAQLKTVRSGHKYAPFYPTWLIFCLSVCHQDNYPPRYAHDLAVGPAAHLLNILRSCFSAKLGFQAKAKEKPPLYDIQKFNYYFEF